MNRINQNRRNKVEIRFGRGVVRVSPAIFQYIKHSSNLGTDLTEQRLLRNSRLLKNELNRDGDSKTKDQLEGCVCLLDILACN